MVFKNHTTGNATAAFYSYSWSQLHRESPMGVRRLEAVDVKHVLHFAYGLNELIGRLLLKI